MKHAPGDVKDSTPIGAFAHRHTRMLVGACAIAVALLYFQGVPSNPPGFFVDEASIAYNAHTIAERGTDEDEESWPLFFRAFGEYKSPVYIYALAALFKITGPSILTARAFSALAGLAAASLLGLLAARVTRGRLAGAFVFAAAALTPWLFEISRLVFEVALFPLALALFLLLLHGASRREEWRRPVAAALGASLGLLVYTYSAGRLVAPLLAAGLALFLTRRNLRGVLLAWIVFVLTLLPLAVFSHRHPGALGERFKYVTYVQPGDTNVEIVRRFAENYAGSFSPRSWLRNGDPEPRHHLPGAGGSLLAGVVVLSAVGLVLVLVRHRRERWWRYVLYGLGVAPFPAALTLDHFHTLRLAALPVFLLLLAAPAVAYLLEGGAHARTRRAALALLLAATVLQGAFFQWRFHTAPPRVHNFDSFYPEVLDAALARPERPIHLAEKFPGAYMYAYWYATLRGVSLDDFRRVAPGDAPPPPGALVISHLTACADCELILERGDFKVYIAH